MNVPDFRNKWKENALKESAASKEHFLDLCHALGVPTPAQLDKTGDTYTFEKTLQKTGGGQGFADVWYRGHFAWEYKGPNADLNAAIAQLKQYAQALENPPLLVTCDLNRFEIHTTWTNRKPMVYAFDLATLEDKNPAYPYSNLDILRYLWTDPEKLIPGERTDIVTQEAAKRFGAIAAALAARGEAPRRVAHFLMQLLFCLFAEDTGLLQKGLFTKLLEFGAKQPAHFAAQAATLLSAMQAGGFFNLEHVHRFNGGLFATVDPVELTGPELAELAKAATLDWSGVEPAIFGTLFERSLDPAKRAQLGAHYTGRDDILRVVDPVVMTPLRRRWDEVRAEADAKRAEIEAAPTPQTRRNRQDEFAAILGRFQQELTEVRILDPASGSGNFLYVALAKLLDLEKEVLVYGATGGLPLGYPRVDPGQLHGLEINEYARELAQVVVWIGYLKWMHDNGFPVSSRDPILPPLETIRLQDALLDLSDPANPKEAEWPPADFIIGNPPFLGDKKLRSEFAGGYVDTLTKTYRDRVPGAADLCCYFFERARAEVEAGVALRAGLLGTNSIRGGANRSVLDRIKGSGDIFLAWSDEPWVLDGAAVRISIVGFDNGAETERCLDGADVGAINSSLTAGVDVSVAAILQENGRLSFIGDQKSGAFDIPASKAEALLARPINPNGRPNHDVVRPWANGLDVVRRPREMWIIDFGVDMSLGEAALYEQPFEHVRTHVKPERLNANRAHYREKWWIHGETRPGMRLALRGLSRFIAIPRISKHRVLVWLPSDTLPDCQIVVFARQDDYFFGVLHSRAHEVWSLRMGTWLGVGNDPRYTPTTCFETFPLPWSPGHEPWRDERLHAIANAARELDEKRNAWLNPPGASEAELKKRTLTNLYNARPAWLQHLHAALDRAVWAAYGWAEDPAETDDETILTRLLALNGERAAPSSPFVPPSP